MINATDYNALVEEAEELVYWYRENEPGASKETIFDTFTANVGWQGWMSEYTDAPEDEPITEQEGEQIDKVLRQAFDVAYDNMMTDVIPLKMVKASRGFRVMNGYTFIGRASASKYNYMKSYPHDNPIEIENRMGNDIDDLYDGDCAIYKTNIGLCSIYFHWETHLPLCWCKVAKKTTADIIEEYRDKVREALYEANKTVVNSEGRVQETVYIWEDGEIEFLEEVQGSNSWLQPKDSEPRELYCVGTVEHPFLCYADYTDDPVPDRDEDPDAYEEWANVVREWMYTSEFFDPDEFIDNAIEDDRR